MLLVCFSMLSLDSLALLVIHSLNTVYIIYCTKVLTPSMQVYGTLRSFDGLFNEHPKSDQLENI